MSTAPNYVVRKKSSTELELEIFNEDHTLGNLLAKRILDERGVVMSYYRIEHPLKNSIILYVKTDGSISPIEAIRRAVKGTYALIDELGAKIEEKLKEAQA
ncbi:MAG: DNA-directed RNA polymerase subunit L [Fervidicoccaceae archaeon]